MYSQNLVFFDEFSLPFATILHLFLKILYFSRNFRFFHNFLFFAKFLHYHFAIFSTYFFAKLSHYFFAKLRNFSIFYFAIFVKQIEAKFREKNRIFKNKCKIVAKGRENSSIITNIEYPAACLLETIMWCKLLQSEPLAVNPWKWIPCQGRIQDLSEGGGQDFLGTKNRAAGEIFFDLKDSKRVKIND